MSDHVIVGVHITNRAKNAVEVQSILTKHGRNIRTRLGLHEASTEGASPTGLILLETVGTDEEVEALCAELHRLHGVQVQRMFFSHPD
jgi:hypothetical protein